jgi:hypothetical protein
VSKSKFLAMQTDYHPAPPERDGAETDVREVMRQIRLGIRGAGPEQEWLRQSRKAVPSHLISSVGRLRASTALLRSAIARIGELPPAPDTFRGRAGASLVRIIRRTLFWLIPSIQIVQSQIVDALEGQVTATEEILRILQQTHVDLAKLSSSVAAAQEGDR